MEYKIDIGNDSVGMTTHGMNDIMSAVIVHPLFDEFSAGNACSAELDLSFWPLIDIPVAAKIVPYCRTDENDNWHQLGIFYLDTRTYVGMRMDVVAYDTMLKAELTWTPLTMPIVDTDTKSMFPCTMKNAATDIATAMGVELDDRSVFIDNYTMNAYPEGEYSRRDCLCDIAAANGGNWIITADGKLLLIPLFSELQFAETNYLITEYGNAITFSETRILI